jgi:lipoprotein NlpI
MHAYERALQANPQSTPAMNAIGMLLKGREAFDKALEFFRAIVQLEQNNGEAWGNLGLLRYQVYRESSAHTLQATVTL